MYAHLQRRLVEENVVVGPGQQIGTCGNTGNSEATHIHLEMRASASPNFTGWFNVRSGVMDAVALFKR
jgi:murein DD-endopeptidase MepM/ murein hydrolase activator NlpD